MNRRIYRERFGKDVMKTFHAFGPSSGKRLSMERLSNILVSKCETRKGERKREKKGETEKERDGILVIEFKIILS